MPSDQNSSQNRRQHYHRGRRGGDRRGLERRNPPPAESTGREGVDVEQIMREIRSRIAARHGIDLSPQQIQELAARRLEAILEPRHVKPALLEQMRRAAGERIEVPAPAVEPDLHFDEASLFESHRGIVRFLRRLLNPILKLLFNPTPIARALDAQAARANAAARREAEFYARQAEWNALHYEMLQRVVTENARNSIEVQNLQLRVEALEARLDFNERRVRAMEATPPSHQPARTAPRPAESAPAEPAGASAGGAMTVEGDSARRRRRRRRGRRGSSGSGEGFVADPNSAAGAASDANGEFDNDVSEQPEDGAAENGVADASPGTDALEPAHHFSLLQPAERFPSSEPTPPAAPPAVPSSNRDDSRERDTAREEIGTANAGAPDKSDAPER